MPFLRAALIKKKAIPQNNFESEKEYEEDINLFPPAAPVLIDFPDESEEEEENESVNINDLHRLIDEKIEESEEHLQEEESQVEETALEEPEAESEPEELESETEIEEIQEPVDELESEEPEAEPEPEEFKLMYDVTSGERYVDKVSTKTEFDKMLDELGEISKDLLSWEVEKFAKKYTGKFQGSFDKTEADARKYEAFLGGYITNAAMTLYDNGYREAALRKLEQSKSILEARKKLEDETLAIKARVEEEDATVDLSDILGLFGDG